jgi:hypothetical protein
VLTTLFDYYAFPADAPGMADRPNGSSYERVRHVETALAKATDNRRFLPSLVIADAGLDAIRQHCPHTDNWLRQIEARLQPEP